MKKTLLKIHKDELVVKASNIRTHNKDYELLKESIKKEGIKQPLSVYKNPKGKYVIWDGQRRFEAGKIVGLNEFSCLVHNDIVNEKEAKLESLRHNLSSKEVGVIDKAIALKERHEDLVKMGISTPHKHLSDELGISEGQCSKLLDIAGLDDEIINYIQDSGKELAQETLRQISKLDGSYTLLVTRFLLKHQHTRAQAVTMIKSILTADEALKRQTIPNQIALVWNAIVETSHKDSLEKSVKEHEKRQKMTEYLTKSADNESSDNAEIVTEETEDITVTLKESTIDYLQLKAIDVECSIPEIATIILEALGDDYWEKVDATVSLSNP